MSEPTLSAWSSERRRFWYGAVALGALCLSVYLPTLRNGFIWDDDNYIVHNPTLRSAAGLARMWLEPTSIPQYYPLVHTTFWVEYQFWGAWPTGYHLVNLLLHALAALVLWRLLRQLDVPGAWIGAALFALHPMQVETVAWATERKNVLSALFYLLAMGAYWRFTEKPKKAWGWYATALLCFVAALLSKTVTSTLPAALAVLIAWKHWPLSRGDWRRFVPLLPLFALGVGMALVTIELEKSHVGAVGAEFAYGGAARLLIAGRVLWHYLLTMAWPWPLMFIYPRWDIAVGLWWQWAYPLGFVLGLVALWCGRRRWRLGPLVAMLLYAGTLTPALGFFNVWPMRYSFVADHFAYLATIPVLALAGAGLGLVWEAARPRLLAPAIAVATIFAALGTITFHYTPAFHSEATLWRDVVRKNPSAWIAHNNLGLIQQREGQLAAAEASFRRVLALKPEHGNAPINLAIVLTAQGQLQEASRWFGEGLKRNPGNPLAFFEAANFAATYGRPEGALQLYAEALRLFRLSPRPFPEHLHALLGAADIATRLGDPKTAVDYLRQARELARERRELALLADIDQRLTELNSAFRSVAP